MEDKPHLERKYVHEIHIIKDFYSKCTKKTPQNSPIIKQTTQLKNQPKVLTGTSPMKCTGGE